MKIIAVVSPKGGSGKSTLTRNLAAAAAGDGVHVAVIDTDAQGTSAEWTRVRADADATPVPGFTAETAAAARWADAAGVQLVLVDTPTAIEKDPEGFKQGNRVNREVTRRKNSESIAALISGVGGRDGVAGCFGRSGIIS